MVVSSRLTRKRVLLALIISILLGVHSGLLFLNFLNLNLLRILLILYKVRADDHLVLPLAFLLVL